MALILNIETSGTVCSVCLAKDGKEIAYRADMTANSHARVLTVFIDELMKGSGVELKNLDAIAVSSGPGSYTGLRIGVSVAKGLCYALNKPLIAVPTLQAIAGGIKHQVKDEKAYYMPAVDARRMDMYTGLYNSEMQAIWPATFATIDKELEDKLMQFGDIWIGGSAAKKCKDFFTWQLIHFVDGIDADARLLIHVSAAKFNSNEFEDVAYYEPFYLKEFGTKSTS